MQIEVVELGDRPGTLTRARRFAPAGARVLGEVLGQMRFADEGVVVLDWSNTFRLMPDEVSKPILYVRVRKRFPGLSHPNVLTVDVRLDVEDIFGGDNMTADSIHHIITELVDKMESEYKKRREAN